MAVRSQVHFRLKPIGKDGKSNIYIEYAYQTKRLKFEFGQSVKPDEWNYKKERVKNSHATSRDGKYALNDLLDKLEKTVYRAYSEAIVNGIPEPQVLKDALKATLGINNSNLEVESLKPTLFSLAERFIKGEIKNKGRDKSSKSLDNYHAVTKHLKGYRTYSKRKLDFKDIDLEFFYLYVSYLTHKLKLAPNTIAKDIAIIKVFMNEAVDLGYTNNLIYKHKKFSYSEVDVDNVYLSESELETLYNLNIENNKLREVRDLFVFGAWVGLRFSDFNNIKPNNIVNIEGNYYIKLITQKTKDLVIIPCNPVVLEIFEKYSDRPNKLPKSISNQKFNEYIKEVCKLAGFVETGRSSSSPDTPLFKLISSHTARRSFATNYYLKGFPTIDLMKITSHRTETSFLKYIKMNKLDTAKRMSTLMQEDWKKRIIDL